MAISKLSGKTKNVVIITLLSVLCVALAAGCVYLFLTKDRVEKRAESIREEILPIAELATYKYNFTEVLYLNDAGNPIGFNNPITSKRYIATVDGSAKVGIRDVESIAVEEKLDGDGKLVEVDVLMPHSEAFEVYIDHGSLAELANDGIINRTSPEDLNSLYEMAEQSQKEKVESSDLLAKSDERAQELIKKQIERIGDQDVKVVFAYSD